MGFYNIHDKAVTDFNSEYLVEMHLIIFRFQLDIDEHILNL